MQSNFQLLARSAICFSAMLAQLSAQQAVTSATLGGRVEDISGGAISGAQIEAQRISLAAARWRRRAMRTDAFSSFI